MSVHTPIRDACKVAHNQEGTVPIRYEKWGSKIKEHPFAIFAFQTRQKCREDHCDKNKNNNVSNMITCVHLGYMC